MAMGLRMVLTYCLVGGTFACNKESSLEFCNETSEPHMVGLIAILAVSVFSSLVVFAASWLCGLWAIRRKPTLTAMPIPFVVVVSVYMLFPSSDTCFATDLSHQTVLGAYGLEMVLYQSVAMGVSWAPSAFVWCGST